ncbi:MAG: helix-turn-helix domain-containing protein [Planctomycetaceae bacterium]|nr:helix-turn-helix domain-containing protein [Planctomycetaceae bacterium]
MSTRRLLTIKDLCMLVGISRRTIYRIRASGQLPAPIQIGGRVRWRPEDIERWLQTRDVILQWSTTAKGTCR